MILDNHMPDTNGFEVMRRTPSPKPCVIMFPADSSPDMAATAERLGADYLVKAGLDVRELIRVVSRHNEAC